MDEVDPGLVRGVVRGPYGEKVGRSTDVEAEPARLADGRVLDGVTLRWLISSRDGAPTYAMRLFEMRAGAVIPEHRHPWEHEIFVVDGSMEVCVEDQCYQLESGDFIYIPPGRSHRYRAGGSGARFICTIPHKPSV